MNRTPRALKYNVALFLYLAIRRFRSSPGCCDDDDMVIDVRMLSPLYRP